MHKQADGVVTPPERNAQLPSATILNVGQLCPLRIVNHLQVTTDAAVFAIAVDALRHDGRASITRLIPQILSVCTRISAEGMDDSQEFDLATLFQQFLDGFM